MANSSFPSLLSAARHLRKRVVSSPLSKRLQVSGDGDKPGTTLRNRRALLLSSLAMLSLLFAPVRELYRSAFGAPALLPAAASAAAAVADDALQLTNSRPYTRFPLLRNEVLHPGDPARGLRAVHRLTFAYARGRALPVRAATDVLKVVHPVTGTARSYTLVSEAAAAAAAAAVSDEERGEFALVVKRYHPAGGDGKHGEEEEEGKGEGDLPSTVSAYLCALRPGDAVAMYGPHPPPLARPQFHPARRVLALALGIGVTHALTAARAALRNGPADARVTLVVAVQYADQGVVLADEIRALEAAFPARFDVVRCASRGERVTGWRRGRVGKELVAELVGDAPRDEVRVMVVGTKAMIRSVWDELAEIGLTYKEHALVRKLSPLTMIYNLVTGSISE